MYNYDLIECKKTDMKFILTTLVIIFAAACGGKKIKRENTPSERKTICTTVDVVGNVSSNEYPRLTALKTVYDTVMNVVVDTSDGQIVQERKMVKDSSYMVMLPFTVTDSAGKKVLKNNTGTGDSIAFRFVPIDRAMVLHDFNKNWPIKP
jgi:hypothetical protein